MFHRRKKKQDDLVNHKYKKFGMLLNYIEHLLILVSAITGCDSFSAFGFLIAIVNFSVELKFSGLNAGNKRV